MIFTLTFASSELAGPARINSLVAAVDEWSWSSSCREGGKEAVSLLRRTASSLASLHEMALLSRMLVRRMDELDTGNASNYAMQL